MDNLLADATACGIPEAHTHKKNRVNLKGHCGQSVRKQGESGTTKLVSWPKLHHAGT